MFTEEYIDRIIDAKLDKQMNVIAKHEKVWENAPDAEPIVLVNKPVCEHIAYDERYFDPSKNVVAQLGALAYSLDVGDDTAPSVRIGLGTGNIASLFGSQILTRPDGPAFVSHEPAVNSIDDLKRVDEMDLENGGQIKRILEHLDYFQDKLPDSIKVMQPDLQGPWNTAQLVRGDAVFYDIFDNPEFLKMLIARTSDVTSKVAVRLKSVLGEPVDRCYFRGTIVKGGSRIANCSTDMISDDTYRDFVLNEDMAFYDAVGGGFMHICGNNTHCIKHFNAIENLTGLEFNYNYIDLFEISELIRPDMTLICSGPVDPPLQTPLGKATLDKLMSGTYPNRNNIVYIFDDPSTVEYAKALINAVHKTQKT